MLLSFEVDETLFFFILRESLFAQSQELTLESSLLILACREVRFLCLQNKLVSSVNKWKSKTLEQWKVESH